MIDEQELLKSINAKLASIDYAGAIADCDQVIKLNPQNAKAYHIRGLAKDRLKQYDHAITDYNQAIRLSPKNANAYHDRGRARAKLEKYDDAINDYNQSITLNLEDAAVYNDRGVAKAELGKHNDAIDDFNQAIKQNPRLAHVYYNRGRAKADLKQYDHAVTDFDQAITLNQQFAEAYNSRGVAKAALGKYDDAIADYDKVLGIDPENRSVIHLKALALAFKQSEASLTASLKEVKKKQKEQLERLETESKKQFEELIQAHQQRIIDRTPYIKREKEYDDKHREIRSKAHELMDKIKKKSMNFVIVVGIAALVLFAIEFGFALADKNWNISLYAMIPFIVAFAVLVWSPMIWQAHILFREAAKYHALREDAFTKGQIIILIDTGGHDKETRYELIQHFITYHEKQSSAHVILNTKPPSIPPKNGLDSVTNFKNWINPKGK